MISKLLVIGNGFDLYHGLPTRYTDFLFLAEHWYIFMSNYNPDKKDNIQVSVSLGGKDENKLTERSLIELANCGGYDQKKIEYLDNHLKKNRWINHFIKRMNLLNDGWIDFEEEMYNTLRSIEFFYKEYRPRHPANQPAIKDMANKPLFDTILFLGNGLQGFETRYITGTLGMSELQESSFQGQQKLLLDELKKDMNNLIKCLNIYLSEFVERIKIDRYSEQIKGLGMCNVMNFNYTDTFRQIYRKAQMESGNNHAVHGELDEDNLVLGVRDDKNHKELVSSEYAPFKKSFQRMSKETGNIYYNWLNYEMNTLEDTYTTVYIMGHSLGKSDEAFIEMIFASKMVEKVCIYYCDWNKDDLLRAMYEILDARDIEKNYQSGRLEFIRLKEPVKI